jgi:hypothetical protein
MTESINEIHWCSLVPTILFAEPVIENGADVAVHLHAQHTGAGARP